MVLLFWSAKGGSGVTVTAAATALVSARRCPAVLVDLGGDSHAALGLPEPLGPGALDWLAAPNSSGDSLFELAVEAADGLRIIGAGSAPPASVDDAGWARLAAACAARREAVILDAGPLVPPAAAHEGVHRSLLVTRQCFLALRRAARVGALASDAVLLTEPGRALSSADVERALGVPVTIEIAWDPAVARAVDAGLLSSRLPGSLCRQLRRLTPDIAA